MMPGTKKVCLFAFTTGLLILANVIRSGVLVDRSFLPRFLLVSVLLLLTWIIEFRNKNIIKPDFFVIAMFLFYLWNLISGFWAISSSEAVIQSQLIFITLVLFLIFSAFCREYEKFENIFIKTHLFALLLSFGLAFYKMSTLVFFDPYKIISVSANNNLYSGFLLLSLPLVFTGYSINKGLWKYLSVLVAILAIFFIIIIQSRAAYIGLMCGLGVSSVLMVYKYSSVFSKKNVLVGTISGIMLCSGLIVFYSSLDNVRRNYFLSKIPVWQYFKTYKNADVENLLKMRNSVKAGNANMAEFDFSEAYYENANLRVIFWKKSACLIKSNPITGVGAGNWRISIPSCKEPANPEHTIKNFTYSQPHNEWIGIISEVGLVGFLLAVIIFFIPMIIVLYRILFGIPSPPVAAVFYCSFIIGFYLFASFDFPLHRIEHNVLLFSIFAFLFQMVPLSKLNFNRKDTRTQIAHIRFLQHLRLRVFAVKNDFFKSIGREGFFPAKFISTVMILLLIFTIFIVSVRINGEYFTLKMFRNEGKNDDNVIHYSHMAENIFYRITPNTLPLAWFEGVAWYRKGEVHTAMTCFQQALKSTPFEVRVLNDYAAALFNLKKINEAKGVLKHTLDLDPFFDDARFNLGAIYYLTGNCDSALFCIKQCRNCQKKVDFIKELEMYPGPR